MITQINLKPAPLFPENRLLLLTKRHTEVVHAVVEGMTNRAVAEKLGITEPTVKTYLSNIYRILQVRGRRELIVQWNDSHAERPFV